MLAAKFLDILLPLAKSENFGQEILAPLLAPERDPGRETLGLRIVVAPKQTGDG